MKGREWNLAAISKIQISFGFKDLKKNDIGITY